MASFDWAAALGGVLPQAGGLLGISPEITGIATGLLAGFEDGNGNGAPATEANGWQAGGAGPGPGVGQVPPATGATGTGFPYQRLMQTGLELGKRAEKKWMEYRARQAQYPQLLQEGMTSELAAAQLAVKRGWIPAHTDYGQALILAGAKPVWRQVKLSDGTTIKMQVILTKPRRRRNYATPIGIRNAGRTLRQMGQIVRTYKGLAKLGAKIDRQLSPRRSSTGGAHFHAARPRKVTVRRTAKR